MAQPLLSEKGSRVSGAGLEIVPVYEDEGSMMLH